MKYQNEDCVDTLIDFEDSPPTPTKSVTLYVACSRNEVTRAGGWGAIILDDDGQFQTFAGGEVDTTSYRLEVIGAVKALEALPQPALVRLVVEDYYLFNGMTNWIHKWKRTGFKKIKHQDVWGQAGRLIEKHTISSERIHAQEMDPLRNQCQQLARTQSAIFSN